MVKLLILEGENGKEKGINAVTKMAKILLALEDLKLKYNPSEIFPNRKPVITPGTLIRGGTNINIVPDTCEAFCDVRLLPNQAKEQVKKQIIERINQLKKHDPNLEFKLEELLYIPAVYINKNEKIVDILYKAAKDILKKDFRLEGTGPWSDAHFFISKSISTVTFGPDGKNTHSENEFVYIDSVINLSKFYIKVVLEFCKTCK